jgi:hypothetical protein
MRSEIAHRVSPDTTVNVRGVGGGAAGSGSGAGAGSSAAAGTTSGAGASAAGASSVCVLDAMRGHRTRTAPGCGRPAAAAEHPWRPWYRCATPACPVCRARSCRPLAPQGVRRSGRWCRSPPPPARPGQHQIAVVLQGQCVCAVAGCQRFTLSSFCPSVSVSATPFPSLDSDLKMTSPTLLTQRISGSARRQSKRFANTG